MTPVRFREVIAPPVWLLAFIYFLFTSLSISIWAAIGNNPALWCQIILTIALVYIYVRWRMVIEVDDQELRVNKAHIELKYLGDTRVLESDAMRLVRGRDADPADYFRSLSPQLPTNFPACCLGHLRTAPFA